MRCIATVCSKRWLTSPLVLAAAMACWPVAAQDAAAPAVAPGPALVSPPAAPGEAGVQTRAFTVHLQVDGNLVGQVRMFDAAGNLVPASVAINFVQNGQLVLVTRSDERGNFQAVGLPPGVYSVIAMGAEGLTAFSLRVLPFGPEVPLDQVVLAMTLIPAPDLALLAQTLGAAMVPPPMPVPGMPLPAFPAAPMAGGGGGGGGGALGVALGAGGLAAGVVALATDDDEVELASPFQAPGHNADENDE